MTDRGPSRVLSDPMPGFFTVTTVRGGPSVPARIAHGPPRDPETGEPLDRSWVWSVFINGDLAAEPSIDPAAAGVDRVWIFGRAITEEKYRAMLLALQMRHLK